MSRKGSVKKTLETLTCQTVLTNGVYQVEMVQVCCARGGLSKPTEARRYKARTFSL